MTIADAQARIAVAPEEVARGGVLSVANVIDVPEGASAEQFHSLLGAEYESEACFGDVDSWTEFCGEMLAQCIEPEDPPDPIKTFGGAAELVAGAPFVGYIGVECQWGSLDENKARAIARFKYAERRFVDLNVVTFIETMETTVAGTYTVAQGIGILEETIAAGYGGPANIIMPMGLVGCACQAGIIGLNLDGSLSTCQGSRVANYVRASIDTSPNTVYATGRITLIRGPLDSYSVPQMIRSDGTCLPQRAIAERIYVPLIECIAVKTEITCGPEAPA